jgi:hypothetical protein
MNRDPDYTVDLTIEDVRLLYQCVIKRLERWEGYPARPAQEQEHLWIMRDSLYRIILEHTYEF